MIHTIISFIKDRAALILAFVISDFLVMVFYTLTSGKQVEIIYPVMLSLFVLTVYLLYDFYHYWALKRAVQSLAESQETNQKVLGTLENEIVETMEKLHKHYATKLFEEASNEIETRRFLSMWIHNMKTPVAVSKLLLERQELDQMDEKQLQHELGEEIERMDKQLNFILELIRLKEFVKDYTPSAVNLYEEVQNLINENKKLFIYNHVFPKVEVESKDIFVLTDKKWNDAVLLQILHNSVKYSMRKKQSFVTISIEQSEKYTTICVKDQGIGIDLYDLERVFEPFFTGENGRMLGTSSGIGLYFCKEICTMLGHTIKITSKKGKGTTVTVTYLSKL